MIANNDDKVNEYILNWISFIVQNPIGKTKTFASIVKRLPLYINNLNVFVFLLFHLTQPFDKVSMDPDFFEYYITQ